MVRVAVIEDDVPTSNQIRGWIEAARPGIHIDQWHTRDEAIAAISRDRYDLVVLDIELGRERHAGVAVINAINKRGGTPVLVVSGMPASIYRSIMKALDAWDYLQKSDFDETYGWMVESGLAPSGHTSEEVVAANSKKVFG